MYNKYIIYIPTVTNIINTDTVHCITAPFVHVKRLWGEKREAELGFNASQFAIQHSCEEESPKGILIEHCCWLCALERPRKIQCTAEVCDLNGLKS